MSQTYADWLTCRNIMTHYGLVFQDFTTANPVWTEINSVQ
jgi:hypothetical protein